MVGISIQNNHQALKGEFCLLIDNISLFVHQIHILLFLNQMQPRYGSLAWLASLFIFVVIDTWFMKITITIQATIPYSV